MNRRQTLALALAGIALAAGGTAGGLVATRQPAWCVDANHMKITRAEPAGVQHAIAALLYKDAFVQSNGSIFQLGKILRTTKTAADKGARIMRDAGCAAES